LISFYYERNVFIFRGALKPLKRGKTLLKCVFNTLSPVLSKCFQAFKSDLDLTKFVDTDYFPCLNPIINLNYSKTIKAL